MPHVRMLKRPSVRQRIVKAQGAKRFDIDFYHSHHFILVGSFCVPDKGVISLHRVITIICNPLYSGGYLDYFNIQRLGPYT